MLTYEEFRKKVAFALARNGGLMARADVVSLFPDDMDRIDFHLHLRQMLGEGLVEQDTRTVEAPNAVFPGLQQTRRRTYLELSRDGWDWVREERNREIVEATLEPQDEGEEG